MFKRAAAIVILLFAAGTMIYVLVGGSAGQPAGTDPREATSETALLVYYFDMGKDCSTCLNLENYTHSTLENDFATELRSGRIRWKVVDVDMAENDHFVDDYQLYTKSVVLVSMVDGTEVAYNNLSRIWELVYDKEAFTSYVRGEIQNALGAAP